MQLIRRHSSTSNILRVVLRSSVDGSGLTGLAHDTSGLIISTITDNEASATTYTAAGSTIETIATLGTFAAPTATKCRFKEVDATNHPGLYELQFADARFAVASAKQLDISISGAANLLRRGVTIQLDGVDMNAISGSATAADNCELMFNGTGYAGGTTKLTVDTVKISGTTTAANALEAIFDGTGAPVRFSASAGANGVTIESDFVGKYPIYIAGTGDCNVPTVYLGSEAHSIFYVEPGNITVVGKVLQYSSTNGGVAIIDGITTSLGMAVANLDTQLAALPTAAENATAVETAVKALKVGGRWPIQ
jgi:hypothetical protein